MSANNSAGKNSPRLAEERAEQARWKPRRQESAAPFERLVETELLAPEAQAEAARTRLRKMLGFAALHVPYYRDLFARLKLSPEGIAKPEDLPQLPELTKAIIHAEGPRLRAEKLPKGEKLLGSHTSSGSTGAPTAVYLTDTVAFFRILFSQRQLRWYRFDPTLTFAWIRMGKDIRVPPDGHPLRDGETLRQGAWPRLGQFFETGPFLGFAKSNPTERIVAWLEEYRPNYLLAASALFEHLAFAFQERPKLSDLRALHAVSEPLTPGMRARIEGTFGVPVHIAFGLDEIGWVATRCREGGRYHVHSEYCLVEIVDNEGRPCQPGEYGRVLITTLTNAAMPLVRYVTDDVAQALDGACPCGRTLPAFGEIIGRHSQMANLPPGSLPLANALRGAMERLAPDLSRPLREYQVRQDANGDFELRLVLAGPPAPGFCEHVVEVWRRAVAARESKDPREPTLSIREVESIALAPSGKFFHFVSELAKPSEVKDFTSDFMPAPDRA